MRYRRWSRITTDRFSNGERRKHKFLGRSGGMLPRELPKHPFPWFPVIQTGYWPVADESLQIGGLLHQGQFPYCSGYEARRVQTIFKINLEMFILLKMYLLWKIWPIPVSRCVETGVDPRLRIQDYTVSLPFCFKEFPAENKWIWAKWPVWISLIEK